MKFTDKKKVWSLRYTPGNSAADAEIKRIASHNGISEVSAGIIYNRGYCTAEAASSFLKADVSGLHDARIMIDTDKAVARIEQALSKGEKITVYGDYDVDGVTSVTLIYLYLRSRGADVNYYIPSRSKEGYGLSPLALDHLKEGGTRLIVTVDTGITANNEAKYAAELGMEMVITDHHECHGDLPDACAVVNPHRPDCPYPFKELAGVGVVFKLVCALEVSRCADEAPEACVERVFAEYSDLVAIGTVADVMPLIDENRVIVKHGLNSLNETERCGLAALIEAATGASGKPAYGDRTQKKKKLNAGFIGFALAPRINAAGRISSAEKAVALLLSDRTDEAKKMADELCEINTRRQKEENSIAEEAYKIIEETHDFENDKVIVLDADRWQQGIIGIVSSRITEKYGLPSILISFDGATGEEATDEDVGKGSGRSIKGMNLVDALDYCQDLLVRFGGHELAAGLSVMRCNIENFKKRINEYARLTLKEDLSCVKFEADCEIAPREIGMTLAEELAGLEPFGVANPTPLFMVRNLTVTRVIGMGGGKHTKIFFGEGESSFQAVYFGISPDELEVCPGDTVDVLCQVQINDYRGHSSVQLVLQDVRLSVPGMEEYDSEKARYREICDGAPFSTHEDILPTRAEVADIYKLLRQEYVGGQTSFSYRMLQSKLAEYAKRHVSYAKLRFAINILDDIRVCGVAEKNDGCVSVEVYRNAAKTNIELSETYKRLVCQCGA